MTLTITKFDKRLKSILVRRKRLSETELDEAIIRSRETERTLSQVLVEEGLIGEEELLGILAAETKIPPVDVGRVAPDEAATSLLQESLASYYGVIPLAKVGNLLTMVVSNPFDILKLDDIQIVTGCDIRPVLSTDFTIRKTIPEFYNRGAQMVQDLIEGMTDPEMEIQEARIDEDVTLDDISTSQESPVVKLVNLVIFQAIRSKASDIHIEPFERYIRVRYRIDGVLHETISPPKKMQNAIVSRIKIMSGMDIAERRKPQDGKFQLRVDGRQIDFRVSVLPVVHGEKVVLRILDSSNLTLNLDTLGFEEKALADIRDAIVKPYGMVLVTGPTGSGKSTTLYSCVREILSIESNIVTVEDPVEYQIEGVNQVPMSLKRGLTFAVALRSILRQDPNIIMVGEIRDLETIEIAVKAALTGHLVFSTLHTNDAPSTITRMVDMGVDRFLVASSTICVAAQRLGRRLCGECKKPMEKLPPAERLLGVGFLEADLRGDVTLYEPVGCPKCEGGYKGRFALLETMPVTDSLRRVIIDGGSALDVKTQALNEGMITLRRAGILNVIRGKTSLEEVLRVTMTD